MMKEYFFVWIAVLIRAFPYNVPAQSSVVINEIMYNPASNLPGDEFIELHNPTGVDVNISGWQFEEGIDYVFPAGTVLLSDGYLVLAKSPEQAADTYGIWGAYGPFGGRLNDAGERIHLSDTGGQTVESFAYLDEHGWPQRADGDGPSLERRHPRMNPVRYQSWAAGPVGGTPGRPNASAVQEPEPIVWNVKHQPLTPTSEQEVHVTCRVDSADPLATVTLFHRKDGEPTFLQTPMESGGGGLHRAIIQPAEYGTIQEFAIQAISTTGSIGRFPIGAPDETAVFQVDGNSYPSDLPLYRIVMRNTLRDYLFSRDAYSDELLDACFYAGSRVHYNVGVRFRGKGSRRYHIKSYRVDFTNTKPFGEIRKLNLNAQRPEVQLLGLEFFKRADMPAPTYQLVSLIFNNEYVREYIQVERCDKDMIRRAFGSAEGNLYRGVERADLDYRGEEKRRYRSNYVKETNEREDDFSDVIQMCASFSNTSDAEFPEAIQREVNVDQWLRWFAIKTVLNDEEGGICNDNRGDDYYIYHRPEDDLFYMLPWDLDTVLMNSNQTLFPQKLAAVRRLLRHPAFALKYFAHIASLKADEFDESRMAEVIDLLSPILPPERRTAIQQVVHQRHADIKALLPTALTVNIRKSGGKRTIFRPGDVWRFFRGKSEPSEAPSPPPGGVTVDWTKPDFDHSDWETGTVGIGYGDNDDQTVLDDMRGNYVSVYTRSEFEIQDPAAASSLTLTMDYDDSFVAYLNGHEVARSNVSGNPPSYTTTADGNHEASNGDSSPNPPEAFDLSGAKQFLLPGRNVLAVEGHNVSLTSSDFSLIPRLEAVSGGTTRILVEPGDECRFFRGRADPSGPPSVPTGEVTINWTKLTFDDSTWEAGPSGIGYGDGDDATVLNDMRENYFSVYMRFAFDIEDPAAVSSLTFSMDYDDGFAAYLNGYEVVRGNVSGSPPAYDQFADDNHEAGTPEEFDLRNAIQYLVAGTNVFAIQGHNVNRTSSDFSLIPGLEAGLSGEDVLLYGTAPVTTTSAVTVNGQPTDYVITEGTWKITLKPQPGINEFLVEARGPDGNVAESTVARVYMPGAGETLSGSLDGDAHLTVAGGPYYLTEDLIVPWGSILTIDAGTQLLLAEGVGVTVYGQMFVNGTSISAVPFLVEGWRGRWKGIAFDLSSGESVLRGCDFSYGTQAEGGGRQFDGVVGARSASLTVEDCVFTHLSDSGIEVTNGKLTARGSVFHDLGQAIHCAQSSALIESCTFSGLRGHEDAIDLDDDQGQPSIIRNVAVLSSEDDGLDIGNGTVLIDSCWISGAADKGISIEGTGLKTITNCIIIGNDIGIEAKHNGEILLVNSTLTQNRSIGIHLLERDAGAGGGKATAVNTILWNNGVEIDADALSVARVSYSDIQGGFPGEHVLDTDPLFLDAPGGDFRLAALSPCADTGSGADAPSVAFDGQPRPLGPGVDMGAYEREGETGITVWELFGP